MPIRLLMILIFIPVLITGMFKTSRAEGLTSASTAGKGETVEVRSLGNASITDLQAAFVDGRLTAESLVERYLNRIEAYNGNGPAINSIITLNPEALAQARLLDDERRHGLIRGPLHGIPFSLKDNINTRDLPTTAGSCLLAGSIPPHDAYVVKKLREAGAILLSKDNMSEFASGGGSVAGATDPAILRAGDIPQGYSSIGGQTRNPHDPGRNPAGSSGGTGAGIAAAFAQFGLGSDTKSSVRGPAATNGIVGLRPTLGLVSRTGLVPLALSFDTIGPMARNVSDVAVVLGIITGEDPTDAVTGESVGKSKTDYTAYIKVGSLRGARIGIGRDFIGGDPEVQRIFDEAIAALKRLGAEIIDPVWFPQYVLAVANEPIFPLIRNAEFKAQLADYFQTLAPGYPESLDDLAARANAPDSCYQETSPEKAFALKYSATHALELEDPVYLAALKHGVALVKSGTEAVFDNYKLDAIVFPSNTRPASRIESQDLAVSLAALPDGNMALDHALSEGSRHIQPGRSGSLEPGMASASLISPYSGMPELVIPAGVTKGGLPVAISFLGQAHSEAELLGYGFDFEQAVRAQSLPVNTPVLETEMIMN